MSIADVPAGAASAAWQITGVSVTNTGCTFHVAVTYRHGGGSGAVFVYLRGTQSGNEDLFKNYFVGGPGTDTITQDTFIQAYTHLAKFEGRSEFETWLTRIAINRSRDSLRRRRFVSLFTANADGEPEGWVEPVDERPDPEREIMARQLRTAIERAERKLSTQQKVIFRLRHYEDRSLEEIAELLGLRSGTVRAHLFRAIHKIRQELAEWVTAREEKLQ